VYYDFFRIIDASTQEDFFLNNPNIEPDDLRLFSRYRSDEFIEVDDFLYRQIDDHVIFGPLSFTLPYETTYHLVFPNDDVDTVYVNFTGDGRQYDDVFRIYFNDELAQVYDFSDEQFQNTYDKTNSAYRKGQLRDLPQEDTYIVTFEK